MNTAGVIKMTTQRILSHFSKKTISMDAFTRGFRPWTQLILEWDVDYIGYAREEGQHEGYLDFHVTVEVREALVRTRKGETYKKTQKPGYKLTVTQDITFEDGEKERYMIHEESFQKDQLRKAVDAFQRELLTIQNWIEIAESRARIMPQHNDVFECHWCGWVTDIWSDDITCQGCGKRYWSERIWKGDRESTRDSTRKANAL
jgi:rubrerythrin